MELDPSAGKMKNSIRVSDMTGAQVRLATDGTMLYVGCHGYAYAVDLNDWSKKAWTADMPHESYTNVSLLRLNGPLYAGSNGTAIQLDPATGKRLNEMYGTRAPDEEVHLASNGNMLTVGCNGYVTGIDLGGWTSSWDPIRRLFVNCTAAVRAFSIDAGPRIPVRVRHLERRAPRF